MCAAESVRTVVLVDSDGTNEVRNFVEVGVRAAENGATQMGNVQVINMIDLDDSYYNHYWASIFRATNLIIVGSFDAQTRASTQLRKILLKTNIPFNRQVHVAGLFVILPACCSCGCLDNSTITDNSRLWAARNGIKWVTEICFAPTTDQYIVDSWRSIATSVGAMM